jgi:WS/DGAT/MGAT family acyltransferase
MKAENRELPPAPGDRSIPMPFSYKLVSPRRQFNCRSFKLADMRHISKTLGYTINDIFISCVSGAMRRYFIETGESVDRPTLCSIPMNLVPLEERRHLGNFSTIEHTWLRVDIEDPMERLKATGRACEVTKEHYRNTREANMAAMFNLMHPYLIKLFGVMNREMGGRIFPISNIVLSNVPGPREQRYILGWLVREWYSTGQVNHGVALNMTVWSYDDQFNFCILTDRAHLTDTSRITDYFEDALNEMLEIARVSEQQPALKNHAEN